MAADKGDVVCVGDKQGVIGRDGHLGEVEVEKERREDTSLRDALFENTMAGGGASERHDGGTTTEVLDEPARERGRKRGLSEVKEEEAVVNSVEGLGEVESDEDGAGAGFPLVEAICNVRVDLQKSRGGRVSFAKAVLMGCSRETVYEGRK